jgi:hypothetical protein
MMDVWRPNTNKQTTQSAKIIIVSVNLFLPPSSNHHFVGRKGNFNYLNSWENIKKITRINCNEKSYYLIST